MLVTCITAFNGLPLLPYSLENLLKFSDKVLICYQDISHKGEVRDVGSVVLPMASDKVVVSKFVPTIKGEPSNQLFKRNERAKHNQMINEARELGATHFVFAAVDHFYDESVKDIIPKLLDYDVTLTPVHTYYKDPTWQITPIVNYFMPFVCKMQPDSRVGLGKYPVLVDEALKVYPCNNWYVEPDIYCHNYSSIGRFEKFNSHHIPLKRSKKDQKAMVEEYENFDINNNKGISYYAGKKIKVVDNYFNLPSFNS